MLVKQNGPFRTVLNEHFLFSSSSSSSSPTPLPSLSPSFSSFFTSFVYSLSLFFPFWLYWVFVALCGPSLVAVAALQGQCLGILIPDNSLCWGAHSLGTWVEQLAAQGLRCPSACGIFLDWGLNLCPLHWQVDS